MKRTLLALLPISLSLVALGCGGSGTATGSGTPTDGSNLPGGTARSARVEPGDSGNPGAGATLPGAPFTRVGLFLTSTDSSLPRWRHVWATVYKLEGLSGDSKPVVLFSSGEGFQVDLTQPSALPGAGIAAETLPSLTRLRLTLAPSVQASPVEQSQIETISLVPALPKDADGRAVLTLTLPKPFEGGVLTLTTNLQKFAPKDGAAGLELTFTDAPKTATALTVVGVLRGGQLALPGGGSLALELSGAQLAQADGSPSPRLTEAAPALVEGLLSPDGKTIKVSRLTLGRPERATLEGLVSDTDPKLGTFALTLSHAMGILPTRLQVSANLDEKAVLRGRGGLLLSREAFLTALTEKSTQVRIEGSYEPATSAFAVRRAWLQGKSIREAHVTGKLTVEEKASRFVLTAPTEWDGFAPGEKGVELTTTSATAYQDTKGALLPREAFLAALKDHTARAVGLLDGDGKLAATQLTLIAPAPKPTPEPEKKIEPEKKTERTPDKKSS